MSAESAPNDPPPKTETLYGTLGVEPLATPEDIKSAFREKAKEYHPDSAGDGKGDPEAFSKLTEAYAKLRDEDRRSAYDQTLKNGPRASQSAGSQQQQSHQYQRRGYSGASAGSGPKEGAQKSYRYGDFGRQRAQAQQEKSQERPDPSAFTGKKRELYEALLDLEREMNERHRREHSDTFRSAYTRPRPDPSESEAKRPETPAEFVVIEAYGRKYLADSAGRNRSNGFENIEKRDGVWIGRLYDRDTLIDPITARSISKAYEEIKRRDDMWIGRIYDREYLIDMRTGKEISSGFEKIERRGTAIVGTMFGNEEIIPQK